MLFKDRADAALRLFEEIKNDSLIKENRDDVVVVSLLRGGVIIGNVLAKKLKVPHLPLVVSKIPAPQQEELALGALIFDVVYLEKRVIDSLPISKREIAAQIAVSRTKFIDYLERFAIKEGLYDKLEDKIAVLCDDGVATGASVKTSCLFLKTRRVKSIILAVPVAPRALALEGIDKTYVLQRDPEFASVSQFYEDFPQVTDAEVKRLLEKN
ncbi:hypothetical protein HYT33_04045 [Candidatus Roizmanbacteria bacterium]|nr:hypothetical protein [Candidatus Roizmanbacteria bacterium]